MTQIRPFSCTITSSTTGHSFIFGHQGFEPSSMQLS